MSIESKLVSPSWVQSDLWSPGPASQAQVMLCLALSCHQRSILWLLSMSCEDFRIYSPAVTSLKNTESKQYAVHAFPIFAIVTEAPVLKYLAT